MPQSDDDSLLLMFTLSFSELYTFNFVQPQL